MNRWSFALGVSGGAQFFFIYEVVPNQTGRQQIQVERSADGRFPRLIGAFPWRCHMQPNETTKPPPVPPKHSNEPPPPEEQPDEEVTGEQPRSRSNEGDPLNAPN